MRVLIVNLGYPPNVIGGAELFVQSLARELVRSGTEASVVSLSQKRADWEYDDKGVRAYFIDAHPMGIALLNPRRTMAQKLLWHAMGEVNVWVSSRLGKVVDSERPDVVHTHSLLGLSTNAWGVVHDRGIPIVHTLHDYQLLCPRGTMFRHDRPCERQCRSCQVLTIRRRVASKLPAAVVGISNFILDAHVENGYFPSALRSIIPSSSLPPATVERPRGRLAGPLRIGFIGRLHPIKGIEVLFEAVRGLPRASYVVKVAGSGTAAYEAHLRRLAHGLNVRFMGWMRHGQFYRDIDVLVVPSVYNEPQGMVLLEAARFGVPAIYANRGGLGEMGSGLAGFVSMDPAKPDSLTRHLLHFIESPSAVAQLKSSIRPVTPDFEIAGRAREYRLLYEDVVRAATPRKAVVGGAGSMMRSSA